MSFTIVKLISAKQPNFYKLLSWFFDRNFWEKSERSKFFLKNNDLKFFGEILNVPNFSQKLRSKNQLNNLWKFGCLAEKGFTIVKPFSAKQPNFHKLFSWFFDRNFWEKFGTFRISPKNLRSLFLRKNLERSDFSQKLRSKNQLNNL